MKIAISGSAGIGKTTLARDLAEALGVPYIPEHYETLFDAPGKYHSPPEVLVGLFNEVLDIKLAAQAPHPAFVADRCPADLLNLWFRKNLFQRTADSAAFFARCSSAMAVYDRILLPPWGVIALEPATGAATRKQRHANPWAQLMNHATISGLVRLLAPGERVVYLPPLPADAQARVTWVLARLEKDG